MNQLLLSIGKVWHINRLANRLLMVSTSLDGFSLANHGRFAKYAKLSCYMVTIKEKMEKDNKHHSKFYDQWYPS